MSGAVWPPSSAAPSSFTHAAARGCPLAFARPRSFSPPAAIPDRPLNSGHASACPAIAPNAAMHSAQIPAPRNLCREVSFPDARRSAPPAPSESTMPQSAAAVSAREAPSRFASAQISAAAGTAIMPGCRRCFMDIPPSSAMPDMYIYSQSLTEIPSERCKFPSSYRAGRRRRAHPDPARCPPGGARIRCTSAPIRESCSPCSGVQARFAACPAR